MRKQPDTFTTKVSFPSLVLEKQTSQRQRRRRILRAGSTYLVLFMPAWLVCVFSCACEWKREWQTLPFPCHEPGAMRVLRVISRRISLPLPVFGKNSASQTRCFWQDLRTRFSQRLPGPHYDSWLLLTICQYQDPLSATVKSGCFLNRDCRDGWPQTAQFIRWAWTQACRCWGVAPVYSDTVRMRCWSGCAPARINCVQDHRAQTKQRTAVVFNRPSHLNQSAAARSERCSWKAGQMCDVMASRKLIMNNTETRSTANGSTGFFFLCTNGLPTHTMRACLGTEQGC